MAAPRRPRPPSGRLSRKTSKVDALPPDVREQVAAALAAGWTLDDIVQHLRNLGIEDAPSRSSIDRWASTARKVREDMDQVARLSEQLYRDMGSVPDDQQALAVVQLARTVLFRALEGRTGDGMMAAEDVMMLMRAVQAMAGARKATVETDIRISQARRLAAEEAAREAKAAATAAVDQVGRERGISRDLVELIKAQILGVRPEGATPAGAGPAPAGAPA